MSSARGPSVAVLVACWLLARGASAQLAGAAAAGAAAGVAAQASQPQGGTDRLLGEEPADWVDPDTGTTAVLSRGCGVVTQVRLAVSSSSAYLNVLISNESRERLAFDPGATVLGYSGRKRRRVVTSFEGHLGVEPGWQRWLSLPLTSKTDLEGQSYLDVDLTLRGQSFGTCLVKTRIVRPSGPRRAETFTPYTVADLFVGVGAHLLTTGNLHELAPRPKLSVGFDFDVFFSLRHGATLDVVLDHVGGANAARAFSERAFDMTPRIEAAGFFLGYVARWPATSWLTLSYSPQLGIVPFQLTDKQGVQATSGVFCPRQRARAVFPFARFLDGHVFAGLTVSHIYVPYGELGQIELSGNQLSGLVVVGTGG